MVKKNISIIGLGYIGLPTAVVLANKNFNVLGCDLNQDIINKINSGVAHFYEPDLEVLLKKAIKNKNLKSYTKPHPADVHIICVPTPFSIEDSKPVPNIEFVIEAFKSIINILKKDDLVIIESTCPVGTTEKLMEIYELLNDENDIKMAYCPERVLPGNTVSEIISNDRIVGGINPSSTEEASKFYKTFVNGKILPTNAKTAELCKLAENSFRDINIAFANELSLICDENDINVWDLIELANHHPRVNILNPGVGVGGHCIAVDPWFIVSENETNTKLIQMGRQINDSKPLWVIKKIKDYVSDYIKSNSQNPKLVCLGLAFKKDIDDLRGSPAMLIVNDLLKNNYNVVAVEPNVKTIKGIKLVDLENALNHGDIFILLVDHSQFTTEIVKQKLKKKKILNFCNNTF